MRCRNVARVFLLALFVATTSAVRADPPKDILDIGAGVSSPDGGVPLTVGGKFKNWIYPSFCVVDGTFAQDFPVTLKLTNNNGSTGTSKIHFKASGTLAPFATLPADQTIPDDGSVVGPFTISVNATGLAPGTYSLTVRASGSPGVTYFHRSINITLTVGNACVGSVIALYTDSTFTGLLDCGGLEVGSATGGTFAIEPTGDGATVVKATNPGAIYYNFIWSNTGPNATPQLDLAQTGFTPTGPDAVHALVLDTATLTADQATFDLVNSTGTSCGAVGPCALPVNTGQTLWVTWVGTWSGVGGPTAGLSNICPGTTLLTETSTLTSSGTTIVLSSASASGYLIPCLSGDVNGDGVADISDVFFLINYIFAAGPAGKCGSGDANGDTFVDISDVFYLINYIFAGGPPPK